MNMPLEAWKEILPRLKELLEVKDILIQFLDCKAFPLEENEDVDCEPCVIKHLSWGNINSSRDFINWPDYIGDVFEGARYGPEDSGSDEGESSGEETDEDGDE